MELSTVFTADADLEARLTEVEALEQPQAEGGREQVETQEQQPAPTPETVETPTQETSPDSTKTDTQATADKPTAEKEQGTDKSSKFAKDAARRDTSWKALNEQKTTFKAEQDAFTAEKQAFLRERQMWEANRVKQSQKDPAHYDQAATAFNTNADNLDLQAKGLDKKAEELEEAGKYGESELAKKEAQNLRNKAIIQRGKAQDAKEYAEHIRKNPDPTLAQIQQQEEGARRHYLMEAAKKYPELAKEGSQFQKDYVAALTNMQKSNPDIASNPAISWYLSQFVAATSEAACVPALRKELGEARAKIKELESTSTPANRTNVQTTPTKTNQANTPEEEEAALRAEVEQVGWPGRR